MVGGDLQMLVQIASKISSAAGSKKVTQCMKGVSEFSMLDSEGVTLTQALNAFTLMRFGNATRHLAANSCSQSGVEQIDTGVGVRLRSFPQKRWEESVGDGGGVQVWPRGHKRLYVRHRRQHEDTFASNSSEERTVLTIFSTSCG